MSDSLTRLRDELSAELAEMVNQTLRLQDQIDEKRRLIARIDQIAEEAPTNPAPTATRQPRRNLQSLVLGQITSHPQYAEFLRSLVETATDTAVTDSSVKRVLDALVKKGKIATTGRGEYFLPIPADSEQKAAE